MQLKPLFLGLLSLVLVSCGNGLSKEKLFEKIDERLKDRYLCFSLKDNNIEFPRKIEFPVTWESNGPLKDNPVLIGLVKGGYMEAVVIQKGDLVSGKGQFLLNLTDKGREAAVWNPKKGACIGRRAVVEVMNWTEPATSEGGVLITRINYRWKIADRPKWAVDELFPSIPGISKPVDDVAVAQKMSDGWAVVKD